MDPAVQKLLRQFLNLTGFLVVFAVFLLFYILYFTQPADWLKSWWAEQRRAEAAEALATQPSEAPEVVAYWSAPSIEAETDEALKEQLRYGKELVAYTARFFGPNGSVDANRTNGLNCQNCHLEAGTKVFGNNYSRVAATYPKVRARSG